MSLNRWQQMLGWIGLALLVTGSLMGLFMAPAERHMGEVSRIFYVHVPSAMVDLLIYTFGFGFAILSLWTGNRRWDALTTGALETGVVLNVLMLGTGMLFARPTWGIWWTWDVRLTFSLLALVLFCGVLALRNFVEDPDRRAVWTAVTTIVAYVDIPLIYFCVRWWRSLHQVQSSPETVDSSMVLPFRINAFGFLFLALWFIAARSRIERLEQDREETPEPAVLPSVAATANT